MLHNVCIPLLVYGKGLKPHCPLLVGSFFYNVILFIPKVYWLKFTSCFSGYYMSLILRHSAVCGIKYGPSHQYRDTESFLKNITLFVKEYLLMLFLRHKGEFIFGHILNDC